MPWRRFALFEHRLVVVCVVCFLQNQDVASSPREQRAETPASATEEQLESAFEQLFTAIVTATDGDRVLCQPFRVLPCRTVCDAFYGPSLSSGVLATTSEM